MTLNLFHCLFGRQRPRWHFDAYLLDQGWLVFEVADWSLEIHHAPLSLLSRLLVRIVPTVPTPAAST